MKLLGVNTVEWPDVWRSLKVEYGGLAHCLKSSVAVLVDDKFLGGENELKELVESKYIYHLIIDYWSEAIAGFASYIRCSGVSQIQVVDADVDDDICVTFPLNEFWYY